MTVILMKNKIDLKKYNTSTLKQTSKDDNNKEYMTECESIKVIDFDSFGTKYFGKKMKKLNIKLKTNDVLFLKENGKYTFIEFKNVNFQIDRNNKINIEKLKELEEKILGSIFILLDVTKMNFNEIIENIDYILVYNKEKNSSFADIGNLIYNQTKNNKEDRVINFGLEKFKNYCFKNVHTYSKEEFEEKFVKKIEKRM